MKSSQAVRSAVRVPSLPKKAYPPPPFLSQRASIDLLRQSLPLSLPSRSPALRTHPLTFHVDSDMTGEFLERGDGDTCIITGAGVSVDSGIRAYRGKHGSYTRAGKEHRPIFFHEFQSSEKSRRRCQFTLFSFKRSFCVE